MRVHRLACSSASRRNPNSVSGSACGFLTTSRSARTGVIGGPPLVRARLALPSPCIENQRHARDAQNTGQQPRRIANRVGVLDDVKHAQRRKNPKRLGCDPNGGDVRAFVMAPTIIGSIPSVSVENLSRKTMISQCMLVMPAVGSA